MLMKDYFIQIFGCDVVSFFFLFSGVNGASVVRRSGDIWVTGCSYGECVTFVGKCGNISLWGLLKMAL